MAAWDEQNYAMRMWDRDHSLWSAEDIPDLANRLGWLRLPYETEQLPAIRAFAEEACPGTDRVVLLGMGGSSMAPEVFAKTFGSALGHPSLTVLDSTHPEAVRAVSGSLDPARTLVLVASKSGGTIETLSLFRYFWGEVSSVHDRPGDRFVALTDPGSGLEALARERGFRRIFATPPEVGGRYSALTPFGLVPAALIGMDIESLQASAAAMADGCGPDRPVVANPGLRLGAVMGESALAGRDKLTYVCSPAVTAFGSWVEQLVAESTGKNGTGIVPVAGEPLGDPESYGQDRLFVFMALQGDEPPGWEEIRDGLLRRGHPMVGITLRHIDELGAEMFRSEMAVASAGSILGINPFDQPDVQVAKDLARQAMSPEGLEGSVEETSSDSPRLAGALRAWAATIEPGDYVGIHAYLPMGGPAAPVLDSLVPLLRDRLRVPVTLGYGPRFLHSTGQLHKGGANNGVFLQLVDSPGPDIDVPEADFSFGELLEGQAAGDYQALTGRDRRVLRVRLAGDPRSAVETVAGLLGG
ncbi:MAG: glucose-6-phosphate isomerase [bacterium]|nr:glucose-6-phosphate isomerase [bacterium]